jgi:AAA family ATP:ADP antiporter
MSIDSNGVGDSGSVSQTRKAVLLKVYFLAQTFLLMTICLVIWRPLKMAIFSKMVGASSIPTAKLFSLLFIIPMILFYSVLVDVLRRHQLVYWFTLFHGIIGIIFYFLISHPVYGIQDTFASPDRWTGWAFYFFMESFDAFFATTFWAFADSICNPKDARNYYGYIVAGSKIGGILGGSGLYFAISMTSASTHLSLIPGSLLVGSCALFAAAFSIYILRKNVSRGYMHGYEVVYQLEKTKAKESRSWFEILTSPIDGLVLIIKNPYVMGIFSLVMFYEVTVVIFDFMLALSADATYSTVGGMAGYYASYYMIYNLIGLPVSILGTTPILRILGLRASLFVFPIMCIGFLVVTLIWPTTGVIFWVLVGLRAFNYALNHPTREVLYIPTTKEIKFKAKAWTDAFGSRIAKSFGSIFNASLQTISPVAAMISSLGLCLGLTSLWVVIAYFLGRTLQDTIDNKKIIGEPLTSDKN